MLLNEIWTSNCLTNIGKFMKRRNLTFTETLNENTLLFFDPMKEKSYILILMSHEKIGVEILKNYIENIQEFLHHGTFHNMGMGPD